VTDVVSIFKVIYVKIYSGWFVGAALQLGGGSDTCVAERAARQIDQAKRMAAR
jgi:hypothetical protein